MTIRFMRSSRLLLATFATLAASAPAIAVTAPDAGQTLQQLQQAPTLPAPEAAPPSLTIDQHPASAGATDNTPILITSVKVQGAQLFPASQLQALLADLCGGAHTLSELQAGAQRITDFYRHHGYPVARAYLPAQDINNGVLTVAVLESQLDQRVLHNRTRLSDQQLHALLAAQMPSGAPIRSSELNRAVLLLNQMPGVGNVSATLRPGSVVGSSDFDVDLAPGARYSGSASLDDYGDSYTGRNRLSGQLSGNNLLGLGDRLDTRATISNDDLAYGRLGWDLPVGNDGLRVGADLSDSRYALAGAFANTDAHGTAETSGLYASYPLLLSLPASVSTALSVEHHRLDDVSAAPSLKEDNLVIWDLSGDIADGSGGASSWHATTTVGDLHIMNGDALSTDQLSGAHTEGRYEKLVAGASRLQALPCKLQLWLSASAQRAARNLDSSEKFVLGGANGIRAYPQGEGLGDEGWLGTVELRYPFAQGLQGIAFYDAGAVDTNRSPYISGPNGSHLSGSGVGLNMQRRQFVLKASLAWRGGSAPPVTDTDRRPRFWAQASYLF